MTEFETKIIEVLEHQNKMIAQQNQQIQSLKQEMDKLLDTNRLKSIGVRAVEEGTFTVSDMETFVKSVGDGFQQGSKNMQVIVDTIVEEAEQTRQSVSATTSRSGLFS